MKMSLGFFFASEAQIVVGGRLEQRATSSTSPPARPPDPGMTPPGHRASSAKEGRALQPLIE